MYVNGQKKELSPIKMGKSKDSQKVSTKTERNILKQITRMESLMENRLGGMKMVIKVQKKFIKMI